VASGKTAPNPTPEATKRQVRRKVIMPARVSRSKKEVRAKPKAARQKSRTVRIKNQCMVRLLHGGAPRAGARGLPRRQVINADQLDRAFLKPNFRTVQKQLYDNRDIKVKGTPEEESFAANDILGLSRIATGQGTASSGA
jgi:hypothetical protein